MASIQVELTEHFEGFIQAGLASGRFHDANEIVREALRLLEQREQEDAARLAWLRGAAKEGFDALDAGESLAVDAQHLDSYLAAIQSEVAVAMKKERDAE